MANTADAKTALANRTQQQAQTPALTPEKGLERMLAANYKAIQSLVPKHVTPERLTRLGLNAASRNPKLFECEPMTLVGAIVNCAALGVEPNLIGHAYILPFWNGKTKRMEAQFQLGFKGAIDLARRSGELKQLYAHEVYEGDDFHYSYGLNKDLHHIPNGEDDPDKVTHFYAVYHLKDGGSDFVVMSRNQVEKHRDRFTKSKDKTGNVFGPWKDHFIEMSRKTVILKLLKTAPLSIEREDGHLQPVGELIAADNSVSTIRQSSVTQEGVIDSSYVDTKQDAEVGPEVIEAQQEMPFEVNGQ